MIFCCSIFSIMICMIRDSIYIQIYIYIYKSDIFLYMQRILATFCTEIHESLKINTCAKHRYDLFALKIWLHNFFVRYS